MKDIRPVELSKPDFFITGKIGSGKDTVADYLKSYFGYYKFRIADTIKRIITERRNISFEELEILKRNNPEIRDEHTNTGDWLGKGANINRCELISKRNSLDWTNLNKDNPFVVCDCRSLEEISVFLKDGAYGIFLSRLTEEYSKESHWTEQNLFTNGIIFKLIQEYGSQMILVLNGGEYNLQEIQMAINDEGGTPFIIEFENANVTEEDLLDKIDDVVSSIIEKENE